MNVYYSSNVGSARMDRQKQQADSLANEWYKRAQLALSKVRLMCCARATTSRASLRERSSGL